MADYYERLGVKKNADEKEIRQAYRRLARQYHPDLNPGDKEAEGKFKRINEAYEVLSDPNTRKKYDTYGDKWRQAEQFEAQFGRDRSPFTWTHRTGGNSGVFGSDPFAGFEDLIGGFGERLGRSRRRTRPARIETTVEVSLEEAFSGTKRNITITTGGKDRRIEVTIPPGVDTNSKVRISPKEGHEILLNIIVTPHRRFTRKGQDLYTDVEVPLDDAVLGGEVDVQTLRGRVRVKVPPESQNGQRIRLTGQGMPKLGSPETKGHLYITIRPQLPDRLTKEERELFQEFRKLRSQKG